MDRIVIADDHPLFRGALRTALERAALGSDVEECDSLASARSAIAKAPTDLVLLDLKMSDCAGFAGLAAIRSDYPTVPVVVVSASEDPSTVRQVMAFGASGFIPKSADLDTMEQAIKHVLAGDTWEPEIAKAELFSDVESKVASLTPSQLRILVGLQQGRLNKQIAWDLGVTEATVKAHLTTLFRKLGVQNRTQAVIFAQSTLVQA